MHPPPPRGPTLTTAGKGGRVRAHHARRAPIGWLNFRERVVLSMWFVPALFVAGAMGLSILTLAIDRHLSLDSSWLPGATPGAAETLAATVASGMLTFTGVVFATTLVAIQLAGGQYSPRVVRVFVRSTLTHVTLGIFLATLVFALNALVETREGSAARVPAVTLLVLYVLMLATLGAFITFCHGIVRLLRVQYLLRAVTGDGLTAIERFVPPEAEYGEAPAPVPHPAPALTRNETPTGVVMSIHMWGDTEIAAEAGGWVELLVQPGEYLALGTPIARLHWTPVEEAQRERISASCRHREPRPLAGHQRPHDGRSGDRPPSPTWWRRSRSAPIRAAGTSTTRASCGWGSGSRASTASPRSPTPRSPSAGPGRPR